MFYLLNVDTPEPTDLYTWAKAFGKGNQRLWLDLIELPGGEVVRISTGTERADTGNADTRRRGCLLCSRARGGNA